MESTLSVKWCKISTSGVILGNGTIEGYTSKSFNVQNGITAEDARIIREAEKYWEGKGYSQFQFAKVNGAWTPFSKTSADDKITELLYIRLVVTREVNPMIFSEKKYKRNRKVNY